MSQDRDKHRPKKWEETLGRLIASIIVTLFRMLESILKAIFRLLSSLALTRLSWLPRIFKIR